MFNFTVQYDEKKWLEMEEQIHNVYSNHPDPRSAEAAYSVSNIISDAFPNINKKEAMRNSQKIIEKFTGYDLDTQGAMTEFVNTMKAQKSDLDVSMTFSKAMLEAQRSGVDSEAYKQKIHEAIEEMGSQKLPYRNDFKDMSLFTDLLVESGRIVPSMIPTMGMYIAGGALSTVTGGASLLAAKAGSSIYSGMMEAGSVAKDLFQVKDDDGNRLSDEHILSAWSLTMAGVGALNLVTDGFEKVTGGIANKVAGKIFSKQATKELVKSGAVKKWGQRIATDYLGKGIAGEAAEEAIEELIGMASSNYIMKHSNETEGTLFEGHSKEDIIKAMAQTAVSTAKGMILTGLPSATVSTIQEYNASDTALKRNANRFSEFNENSAAVSINDIKVPSGVKETDAKKASEPIKVIQIGDLFKPLDEAHAGLVAGLKKKGAKALNIEVAETSSQFTKESVQSARSFARANEAVEKNGVVVFGDTETMQKKARDYALNQKSVVGYHENENEIIIDREEDGITHSLILRTEEGVKKAVQSEPVSSTPEPTEAVLDESEEITQETEPEPTESELYEEEALLNEEEMSLDKQETVEPEQVVKKQYNHYNRTLQRKGAKPEEVEFLNKTILPQIHDTIKQQAPNMTEEEAYKLSIPSTYFAFVASKVAKTDVNTFFNENFNAQPFIALSMEQESDFLNSQEGIASAEVQIGNAKPLLNGLTYRKGNKHQIGLAKGFTPTTVVHEMGHVLVNVIKDTEQFAPFLNVYASQLEQDGGSIGTHFQEAFAKDLEQYFIDGKIRDSSLGTIFKEIGQAIRDFLGLISPQLDRETRIAFDRLFDFKLEQESKTEQETTAEATKAPQLQLDLFGEPNEVVDTLASLAHQLELDLFSDPQEFSDMITAFSPEESVNSPSFKKWFKNSEFVNKDGSPRIAYHGTKAVPKKFKALYDDGLLFFTVNPKFASDWAINNKDPLEEGKLVYDEAYEYKRQLQNDYDWEYLESLDRGDAYDKELDRIKADIKKRMFEKYGVESEYQLEKLIGSSVLPVYLSTQKIFHPERDIKIAEKLIREGKVFEGNSSEETLNTLVRYAKNGDWLIYENANMVKALKELGYDSMWLRENTTGPMETIAVFSPNQVKSIFNQGGWSTENDEILASISREVDLDTTKRSLENHYYVPDSTLKALEGDPDVDWEIQFRRIMLQDPTLFKTFQRALKTVEDGLSGEHEVTAEAVLKVLEENQSEETFTAMKDEVRNPERFVERLIWQSRFEGAKKADRKFSRKLTDKEYLLDVVRTLLKNMDMGSIHNDLPPEFYSLDYAFANNKDTEYRYKEARKAIRNDLRRYRRDFYKHKGMLPQLSYEKTVEGTYLDEGIEVEAFGNEELRKLLEAKDTDPVVKEMIRKNLATGDVVETLVNTTREQLSQLEADLMGTEAELQETSDALVNKTGELEAVEKNVAKLEDKYHNLQKTNKKNYEHGRMTERKLKTREKYINAMKLKQIIERANKAIKNIASSKSNTNDAKIMDKLNKIVDILYASSGEELSAEFDARKIGIQDIPSQLMPFFEFVDDGVYAQNPAKGMDIRTLIALRNAVADVRSEAKYEKTLRDEALKRDTFKLANDYLATNNNKSFENVEEFRKFMAQEKLKGKADKEGNKALSFFERNFITMNRLIDKLDPAQKTLKPYIFGGYDGNGVFHRGIEGVLDDEKREEFKRYQAAKQVMKDLNIDRDSLLKKHVPIDVDTETNKRGKEKTVKRYFTLEEAIGIYIYSKQPDAMEKLTSPDGNKLVIERDKDGNIIRNDVETVINSLTDEHKKFGDWLMNDMGGRYNEVANVYYKINNKSLEKIANYFPLIRTGEHIAFSDLMEDQYLNMQENPEDSMTRKRTGGDYPLQLNALSIWNKMVSRQEHYIAGAEFFHQTNWLMHKNGGDMYNLIAMNAGKDYATALQDFLNRVANKRYIYDDADTMINRVRANMVVARLGFNILTMAKQIPALGLFAMEFGPKRLFEAITHMTTDYKGTSEFVYEKAPQMRGHSVSIDFSSFAQLEAKTPLGRKVKKIGEAGMTPIQFIDGFIKNTLWYGAYQNNLETMTEEQAAMEATRWINETQPGGTTKDTAAIYDTNSTIMKYLLMFTSQLNKNLNIVYDIPRAMKNQMYSKALKNTLGLGLSLAGIMAFEGGFSDEDDDDKMWDDMLRGFSAQMVSMMPIFGSDISDIVMDRYYSGNGLPMVSEASSFIKAIESKEKDRIRDRGINFGLGAAEFSGLPSGQMKKIWNAFEKDDEWNMWYLLGGNYAEK